MPAAPPVQYSTPVTFSYSTTNTTVTYNNYSTSSGTLNLQSDENGNYVYMFQYAEPVRVDDDNPHTVGIIDVVRVVDDNSYVALPNELSARAQERREAENQAEVLLLTLLSEEQRQTYREDDLFEVIGSAGGRYRIRCDSIVGNVDWLKDDGSRGGSLCAHPEMRDGWLPNRDVALAQLLALTTDEPGFVRVANVHRGQRPPLVAA